VDAGGAQQFRSETDAILIERREGEEEARGGKVVRIQRLI
jgi:hypothetical protein